MKVGIASFYAPWNFMGGVELHAWELAKGLVFLGNEVHFFFADSANKDFLHQKSGVYLHQIKIPGWYCMNPTKRRIGLPLYNMIVQQKIKHLNNFDIFHSQNFDGTPLLLPYTPLVVTIHTVAFRRYLESQKHFLRGIPNDIATLLEHVKSRLHAHKAKYIAVSENVQEDLENLCSIKSVVIPDGVNKPERISKEKAKEELGISNWEKVILFFSRVTREKSPHKLLDIVKDRKDVGLLIGGEGPFIPELRKIIQQKGLQTSVKILGYVNPNDVKYVFSAADCFALPSEQVEGQPITILEAMSYGLPCYVTDLKWVPSYSRDYAFSGDVKEGVSKALEKGKQNIHVRTRLDAAKEMQEVYKEILKCE